MSASTANKSVYLNGVLVGEVPATGSEEQDILAIRDFLRSRGLYKETTLIQAMFRQAVSFAKTSSYLYKNDLQKVPRNGMSVVPFVVNSAFSIELYLKTLAQVFATPSVKEHKLLPLFDALPDEAKNSVLSQVPACLANQRLSGPFQFREALEQLNNAFVEWRYCYESGQTSMVPVEHTIVVMQALHNACRGASELA